MKLPIPITDYNEIHVSFDLGIILDGYSRYVKEQELDNSKLDDIFDNEETVLIIENIIYNKSKKFRENSMDREDHECYGQYFILTKDNFYKTDGISEVNLLCKSSKWLKNRISEFLQEHCISKGFELYRALEKLS